MFHVKTLRGMNLTFRCVLGSQLFVFGVTYHDFLFLTPASKAKAFPQEAVLGACSHSHAEA